MTEEKNNVESVVAQVATPMLNVRNASTGTLLFQGILLVVVGLALISNPVVSLVVITSIAGVFMIINSIFMIIGATKLAGNMRTSGIVSGALVLILGVLTILHPLMMNVFWIIFLGIWEVVIGIGMLSGKYLSNSGYMKFSGLMLILVGIVFMIWPLAGLMAFVWVAGILMVVSGVMLLIAALRISKKK